MAAHRETDLPQQSQNPVKDPEDWTTGDEPLTGPQASYLKTLLQQAATLIKNRKLMIRIEVHVALGTKATAAAAIKTQKLKDKQTAQKRALAVQEALVAAGVPAGQLQAVGIGAERPLATAGPTDPAQDRVDLIKSQQGAP